MLDEPLGRGWSSRSATARSATALTGARTRSPLTGTAGTLALSDTTRALKRAAATGSSLRPFRRLGNRNRYKGCGSHSRGHHHRDSGHASHHRLLGKRHWKPSVKRGGSARRRHLTQVRVDIFNGLRRQKFCSAGACASPTEMANRRHLRYSFDQVLKRSPRFTRAASSRITSGVRRMTRVVPCRPRRYRE